jgi:hypothetical protein
LTAASTDILTLYSGYKALMKSYVGLIGASSPQDKLFACPADLFYPNLIFTNNPNFGPQYVPQSLHDEPFLDYSSYAFNGGNNVNQTNKSKTFIRSIHV